MKRRGMFLIELGVAGVLLVALSTLCVKYFMVTAAQRLALNQRQTAIFEASNIQERIAAEKFSALTPEMVCQNIAFNRGTISLAGW